MRPLSTLVVFVLALGALLCFSAPASAALIFQDDFEGHAIGTLLSGAVSPPVGDAYTGSVYGKVIAGTSTNNTSQVVGTRGGPTNRIDWLNVSAASQAAAQNQVVTFRCDAYVASGTSTADGGMSFGTFTSLAYAGGAWNVDLFVTGEVKYYDTGWHTLGTFATDQWNPVEVVADYGTQTFKITVGNVVGLGGNFQTAAGNNTLSALSIGLDAAAYNVGSSYYYDNVSIQVPEPSALLLLATGGVLACARRKRK